MIELYTYDPDLDVPNGVVLRDASEVYPKDAVFTYDKGRGKGSVAAFANLFRYKLLLERGGWWVDTDILYTGQPVPKESAFFGWETDTSICNAILRFPKESPVMEDCLQRAQAMGKDVTWGEAGPQLVTHVLKKHGRAAEAHPQPHVYPVRWQDAPALYVPERRQEIETAVASASAPFVHMWNSILKLAGIQRGIRPPDGSYLDAQIHSLGVDWPKSHGTYTAAATRHMAENYRLVRTARPMNAKLSAIEGSRSWRVVSFLRHLFGREPLGDTSLGDVSLRTEPLEAAGSQACAPEQS